MSTDHVTIEILKGIIRDTIWMARRYADGRMTYAPGLVNAALDKARKLGVEIDPDTSLADQHYATDGSFGTWNPETQSFNMKKPPSEAECVGCEEMFQPEEYDDIYCPKCSENYYQCGCSKPYGCLCYTR